LKRLLDIVVSALLLVLLLPLLVVVGIAVRVVIGRPVFFRQSRPGLHGVPFELLKFRTMTDAADPGCLTMPDEQRLGRFGAMLRELSLDELPELLNVIKGEMSLVGPRPLLMHYLDRYDATQARRHEAPPGITGWAQINGRNAISWEERFALDVWYVDHRSLRLDLKILMITVRKVFRREGITQPGHATMPEFTGRRS
jgi:lipopolysaccharide/colanic/teichoic acid biosynthesis glycosyltransferase